MKSVLILGAGNFGSMLARQMNEHGYEIMIVDARESLVNAVMPFVTDAQIGDCTNPGFLRTLGVDNYDLCFVCIGEDFQSSLEITSLLKELGARKVISLACRDVHRKFLLRNGADDVIYPEKQMASWAAIRYAVDHVLDYIALDSEFAIYDVEIPAQWEGKTVGALDIRKRYNLNVLAVRTQGAPTIAVGSDTVLHANQTILVLGTWKDVQKCFKI